MCRVWFGSVRACAVSICVGSYMSWSSHQKIDLPLDIIIGGQYAHAPALMAALAASVPTMYFAFGASLSSRGLAPKLNKNCCNFILLL